MTDDTQSPAAMPASSSPPAAMPWYRSQILQGILTAIIAQLLARLTAKYHIDFSALGITANGAAQWVLDAVSAGAIAYAAHGRITQKAAPLLTASSARAAAVNSSQTIPKQPAPPAGDT